MIFGVEDVDQKRRDKLISLLDIDLDWRLNKVSDGQRRRVQICMGLLKPYKVARLPCYLAFNHSSSEFPQIKMGLKVYDSGGSLNRQIPPHHSKCRYRLSGLSMDVLQVLLLDEVTVDMDIVGRLDLLNFFKEECTERGATIVYATHIFDGLESWATHIAYVSNGALQKGLPAADVSPPLYPACLLYLC